MQAQDRCHRIGQTKPVVVYRMLCRGTIDEDIVKRATAKRRLEKMIIHQGKLIINNFFVNKNNTFLFKFPNLKIFFLLREVKFFFFCRKFSI